MDVPAESAVRIDIGAGAKKFPSWLSVGLEDHHDIRCDIRKLDLPDHFADAAMAIHVLEHIDRNEAPATLAEWRRVLKPGGKLAIELPELFKVCRLVLTGSDHRAGQVALFGEPNFNDPLMLHKWCWSAAELANALREAGFRKIKFKPPEHHGRRDYRDIRVEARA